MKSVTTWKRLKPFSGSLSTKWYFSIIEKNFSSLRWNSYRLGVSLELYAEDLQLLREIGGNATKLIRNVGT